jgi:hypothetical protein
MIQLSQAKAVNTVAFYPNVLPASGSNLYVEYTQSFDKSNGVFQGAIISNPQNTPYVIANIAGAALPDATGQYVLISRELIPAGVAVWDTDFDQWETAATPWDDATGTTISDVISEDRAFISGSDVVPITQYVSPDENATYTTYLG